jgi:hypothetical protein
MVAAVIPAAQMVAVMVPTAAMERMGVILQMKTLSMQKLQRLSSEDSKHWKYSNFPYFQIKSQRQVEITDNQKQDNNNNE